MGLTKADLLAGAGGTKDVHIEALGAEVTIRPLTDDEFHEVQKVFLEAVSIDLNMDDVEGDITELSSKEVMQHIKPSFDFQKFAEADHDSNLLAAAYGLTCNGDVWTADEVRGLRAGAPEQIATAVFDYTGVSPGQEEVLRSFRSNESGSRDTATTKTRSRTRAKSGKSNTRTKDRTS